MRKQLARVGAIAVAAMMVGTTAFAAQLTGEDIKYAYTDLDTVRVTVPGDAGDQATILAVEAGTALAEADLNGKIAYINQDGVTAAQGDIGLFAVDATNTATFTFDTTGPLAEDYAGKIDIYAAGTTHTINGAGTVSIYQQAPVESIALEKVGQESIEVASDADSAAIKTALGGKAKIVLTHDTTAADPVVTEIPVADASEEYTFSLSGSKVGVKYTPGSTAKYGLAEGFDGSATADGQLDVEIKQDLKPTVVTGVKLTAAPASFSFQMGTEATAITKEALIAKGLKVTANYEVQEGTQPKAPEELSADKFNVSAASGQSPYTLTISAAAELGGIAAGEVETTTITATVLDTATVSITGTVQSADTLTAVPVNAANALVVVYDGDTIVGFDMTDTNGEFSVNVAPGKDYRVVASYLLVELEDGAVVWAGNYGAKAIEVPSGTTTIAEPIVLYQMIGDANGDGIVNISDSSAVGTGYRALNGGSYLEQ